MKWIKNIGFNMLFYAAMCFILFGALIVAVAKSIMKFFKWGW